jgi:hypothetical protein
MKFCLLRGEGLCIDRYALEHSDGSLDHTAVREMRELCGRVGTEWFGPAELVKSRALVCTLCREFASFMSVYREDVSDSDVQNLR